MPVKLIELQTVEQVDSFLRENALALIFKAGTCHKTMQGWSNIEALLRNYQDISAGFIRVVDFRSASNHVANITNIVHHSPQIILFKDGQATFDLDNWNITKDNLQPLFDQYLISQDNNKNGGISSNLNVYKELIDRYLNGKISENEFQMSYLTTFRDDHSLRSQEEFALLDSLFGNPDEYHIHPQVIIGLEHLQTTPLRQRVEHLALELERISK